MPEPRQSQKPDASTRWVPAISAAGIAIAAAPVIVADWHVGRAAYDHLHFHLPAVEQFIDQWPHLDFTDYGSATTPGYHVLMAAVSLLTGLGAVGLRWVSLAVTMAFAASVGYWCAKRIGWTALAVTFMLCSSLYVYSSGAWILPDNAGWLGLLAVLSLCLGARITLPRALALIALLIGLVLTRQIHIWALSAVMTAAWLDARAPSAGPDNETQDPPEPFSLREWQWMLTPTAGRLRSLIWSIGMGAPALIVLGVFVAMWGGLVPPRFAQLHASNGSPAATALFLSLFGSFAVFFAPWWWDGLKALLARRRRLLVVAVVFGLAAALIPETSYSVEGGRFGAIWSVAGRLPAVAERSLLILAMTLTGSVILAAWLISASSRTRWVVLVSCAGFCASASVNSIAGQRYFEPMVMLFVIILAASPLTAPPRWAWIGPFVRGLSLAAIAAAALIRSTPMDYPDNPKGNEPLTSLAVKPAGD